VNVGSSKYGDNVETISEENSKLYARRLNADSVISGRLTLSSARRMKRSCFLEEKTQEKMKESYENISKCEEKHL